LIHRDQRLEAELIAHLGEVDARRLYLDQACPSMFEYCVQVLHFAECVAYKRIAVARAARKFPELTAALEQGDLHLTAASLIAPHLNREYAAHWIAEARHKTAQEIREQIADRMPKAAVPSSVRLAPARRSSVDTLNAPTEPTPRMLTGTAPPPTPPPFIHTQPSATIPAPERSRARCEPLGAKRYCIRFEADESFHAQLQELRALLRHQIPDGDVAKILAKATHELLKKARKQKTGTCKTPHSKKRSPSRKMSKTSEAKAPTRVIPVAIRRAVWGRDKGRCTAVSQAGRQCNSRDFIEFHHEVPWARCLEHAASNIHLRCRSHNQHAAERDFGIPHMARFRKRKVALSETNGQAGGQPQLDLDPVDLGARSQPLFHEDG
jgi:5-methylcytosine-specific restriction endonuclease McrA